MAPPVTALANGMQCESLVNGRCFAAVLWMVFKILVNDEQLLINCPKENLFFG